MNCHDRLSNAFSKSTRRINPSIYIYSYLNIISYIILVQSGMVLQVKKSLCSLFIMWLSMGLTFFIYTS